MNKFQGIVEDVRNKIANQLYETSQESTSKDVWTTVQTFTWNIVWNTLDLNLYTYYPKILKTPIDEKLEDVYRKLI